MSVEARDELGDLSVKRLIVEIMGRHSNIILVDDKDLIIDSIKRIGEGISRLRQVLPGSNYNFPPSQNKHNPLIQDEITLKSILGMSQLKELLNYIQTTGVSRLPLRDSILCRN